MNFVFATHNAHKIKEASLILSDTRIQFSSLSDLGINEEIREDGDSLKENAWIKADFIYNQTGGNVIAEDTGLEVDVLDGAPGVYSARYAGNHKNSTDNITKLLFLLQNATDRSAQFRTILAVWLNGKRFTFEGIIRGTISHSVSGVGGFGYDPVFVPNGYEDSFGILSPEIKNEISHRAKAFEKFKNFILNQEYEVRA